jgi:hypothetical protein
MEDKYLALKLIAVFARIIYNGMDFHALQIIHAQGVKSLAIKLILVYVKLGCNGMGILV